MSTKGFLVDTHDVVAGGNYVLEFPFLRPWVT